MVRSVGAVGTFVLGLHKKREKVHHPGLQHVRDQPGAARPRPARAHCPGLPTTRGCPPPGAAQAARGLPKAARGRPGAAQELPRAGPRFFDFLVNAPPPAPSGAPGPLNKKQKQARRRRRNFRGHRPPTARPRPTPPRGPLCPNPDFPEILWEIC